MLKRFSRKKEESKPSAYFSEVKAAQKQDKTGSANVGNPLRADRVPSSNIQPARESLVQHEMVRAMVGILLGLVIVGLILFLGVGPGKPILEQGLAGLVDSKITPSATSTLTQVPPTLTPRPATDTPIPATHTPTSSTSPRSTNTQVVVVQNSATPITPSPTLPGCRDVSSITLDDVGQTLCVQGIIIETIDHPSGFMVIFNKEPGSFYWVSYDWVWSKAKLNRCYQITGEIFQMGKNPILLFDYHNEPQECP